ncbi:MAG: S8 family serine peptidase [Gemmatimonadota bacterium]|nr:MAG: S8 family serine peptidase [Gemmatimonadota bacterium]
MANLYYESPLTDFAHPNFILQTEPLGAVNDEYYPEQWGLSNTGSNSPAEVGIPDADIDAPEAWDICTGSPDIVIAIIDCGVWDDHGDLKWKLVGGYDTWDDDNFTNPDMEEEDDHGTCCAGIAASSTNNDTGVASIGYNCKMMPIRIGEIECETLCQLVTTPNSVAAGFDTAWSWGAHVLSNSWAMPSDYDAVHYAIQRAKNAGRDSLGCVIICGAGNKNTKPIRYPARYSEVIAVGATSECDERKNPSSCDGEGWGSSYGPNLDVAAPGVHIWTTSIMISAGNFSSSGFEHYRLFRGTSAACPHVAGTAALVLSMYPDLNSDEVQEILQKSAEKVRQDLYDYIDGRCDELGYGRVNAYWALLEAGAGEKGDMNRDMSVDLLDPPVMLDIILGYDDPDDYQQWAGDMNYDGEIDLLDYMLLWDKVLYGEDRRSIPEIPSEPAIVYLSKVPGPTGAYSVMLENSVGVAGVQLWISYNPQAWTPGEPKTTDRSAMLDLNYRNEDGELMVMLANPTGDEMVPGTGPIVHMSPQKSGGSLHITRAILCTATGTEIPVVIRRTGSPKLADQSLPNTFMLSQNYPNPFNPETEISFQIPSATYTSLKIFNILGQEVKTLVDEHREVGHYTVTWSGRDEFGREVSSSIYFYTLKADRFTATKRMLLLK